jgi:hypothetical protein
MKNTGALKVTISTEREIVLTRVFDAPRRMVYDATFFHNGTKALAAMLPNAEYRSLEDRSHSAVLMAPQAIADAVQPFFVAENK